MPDWPWFEVTGVEDQIAKQDVVFLLLFFEKKCLLFAIYKLPSLCISSHDYYMTYY